MFLLLFRLEVAVAFWVAAPVAAASVVVVALMGKELLEHEILNWTLIPESVATGMI